MPAPMIGDVGGARHALTIARPARTPPVRAVTGACLTGDGSEGTDLYRRLQNQHVTWRLSLASPMPDKDATAGSAADP